MNLLFFKPNFTRRGWRWLTRGGLWLMILLGSFAPAVAQTNFYTILTNGPASNRVNVVILAEGYRAVDYAAFRSDATNVATALFATEPFAEYKPYLNVFAIAVPSVQAGSDHPSSSSFVNTYFNSSYDVVADYLISIPSDSTGQGKVDALLATYLPQTDLAILLVNDGSPGGSDNGGKIAVTSRAANSISYIPIHEAGHVLGKLGDEYTSAYPGYPDVEEPNTTRETNRALIKWNAWIAPATPVPTPNFMTDVVGLFEGAHYHITGWYRPKVNCMMFSAGSPFCEICRETLILAIGREARPIEGSTPVPKTFTTTSNSLVNFALTTLQPVTHSLQFQWLTNGIPVPGAINSSFSVAPGALGNGTNVVAGRVSDPTAWVRADPTSTLVQTQSWTMIVSIPQLQLGSPRWLADGRFAFQISGVAPAGFVVQGSTGFSSWTNLATNILVSGIAQFTNQVGNLPLRFYRAVTPP